MKRDWDLVLRILEDVEAAPANQMAGIRAKDYPEYGENTFLEHLEILVEGGLIYGHVKTSGLSGQRVLAVSVERMTWEGQDFLANARVPGVWQKVKDTLAETGGEASLAIVKALAAKYAPQMFGL